MLISEIYQTNPKTINEDTTVGEALKTLIDDNINSFIVTNSKDEIVGIFSTQDIAASFILPEFKENINLAAAMYKKGFFHELCQEMRDNPVKKYMRTNYIEVSLDTHVIRVAADFLNNDLYSVPVVENGKLIGIVTRTEIKKAIGRAMGVLQD